MVHCHRPLALRLPRAPYRPLVLESSQLLLRGSGSLVGENTSPERPGPLPSMSPFPSTPDPGPKAGEGMLAPHCTSLADAIGGKVGVQFPQRAPLCPFLLKRDRGAWQVRGGGLPLLTAALLRGCTHDVLREPPKTVSSAAESREPWAC